MKKTTQGLTLSELMVVVAVIGIIAAVAYPSYQSQIRKSRRSEALTMLQAAQLAQERYRLDNATYAGTANFTNTAFAGICRNGVTSPCASQNGYYELTATDATSSTYTVTATPKGDQVKDTKCAAGISASRQAASAIFSPTDCWSK